MKLVRFWMLLLVAASVGVVACGDEKGADSVAESDQEQTAGELADADAQTSTDDTASGSTGTTPQPVDQVTTWCTDICNKQNECTAVLGCQNEMAACVQNCATQNVTIDVYNTMIALTCEQINQQVCADEANQQYCSCDAVENPCADGQACFPLNATTSVCAGADGGMPADAPMCDQQNPCGEGESCVVTQAGATAGVCLQGC